MKLKRREKTVEIVSREGLPRGKRIGVRVVSVIDENFKGQRRAKITRDVAEYNRLVEKYVTVPEIW